MRDMRTCGGHPWMTLAIIIIALGVLAAAPILAVNTFRQASGGIANCKLWGLHPGLTRTTEYGWKVAEIAVTPHGEAGYRAGVVFGEIQVKYLNQFGTYVASRNGTWATIRQSCTWFACSSTPTASGYFDPENLTAVRGDFLIVQVSSGTYNETFRFQVPAPNPALGTADDKAPGIALYFSAAANTRQANPELTGARFTVSVLLTGYVLPDPECFK